VKNITVTVDEDTYHRARVKAAEQKTSVSAVVKNFLNEFARGLSDAERLKIEERSIRELIKSRGFCAADRLSRDEAHRRHE
jgi:hypothetical protein